jgi:hypothetical protein
MSPVTFPVVFPQAFMTVTALTNVLDMAILQGAGHHGAVPPLFRSGPHAVGMVGIGNIQARWAMILTSKMAGLALSSTPHDGRYSLLGFLNTFLQGPLAGAAADVAHIGPLVNWWHCALTNIAVGGASLVASGLLATATPALLQSKAMNWVAC